MMRRERGREGEERERGREMRLIQCFYALIYSLLFKGSLATTINVFKRLKE